VLCRYSFTPCKRREKERKKEKSKKEKRKQRREKKKRKQGTGEINEERRKGQQNTKKQD
jgi:hypothetical protein